MGGQNWGGLKLDFSGGVSETPREEVSKKYPKKGGVKK